MSSLGGLGMSGEAEGRQAEEVRNNELDLRLWQQWLNKLIICSDVAVCCSCTDEVIRNQIIDGWF